VSSSPPLSHSRVTYFHPDLSDAWLLYLSREPPERLVVFVHGFLGKALKTWERFQMGGRFRPWWRSSDMLFVGYDSRRLSIKGMADRLRDHLPVFYPDLPSDFLEEGDVVARVPHSTGYRELILTGHSLGGVVLRRTLCDVAQRWREDLETNASALRPPLLDAQLRLFSPASAGFRPGGWMGLMRATGFWTLAIEPVLRSSTAYSDLQQNSGALLELQKQTELIVRDDKTKFGALRAWILWADRDEVVEPRKYADDHSDDSEPYTSHSAVCKPNDRYVSPWIFVETGARR
jgi:hypothetical protein